MKIALVLLYSVIILSATLAKAESYVQVSVVNVSPERAAQIEKVVREHIRAEGFGDIEAAINTYADEAVYEDRSQGIRRYGKEEIAKYYRLRDKKYPRKRAILDRIYFDEQGATIELTIVVLPTEETNYKVKSFPMIVHYNVNDEGLITEERSMYDLLTAIGKQGQVQK